MCTLTVSAVLVRPSLVPAMSTGAPAAPYGGGRRALSSHSDFLQASSSSFELILTPNEKDASREGSNNNKNNNNNNRNNGRRRSYSMKKETSELIQTAIASTIMTSGRCNAQDSSVNGTGRLSYCPYQAMVVTIERAEWTQPDDPLTVRFYVVATIRSDQDYMEKRAQSSSFDLRQELDAFVLDFFYGDLFLATIREDWSDDDDDDDKDEVLTHAMMANVALQVSESQGRIYQTSSPTAPVVFLAVAFVLGLFIVDGLIRYTTPVHLCAARQGLTDLGADGAAVERETLKGVRTRELV
jgi:hypothetical protein